jgi:hypothetical protein
MTTDKVTESLLNMYEKHKKYLEDAIIRMDFLDGKFKNRNDSSYKNQSDAYGMALDNLKSLFGGTE